MINDESAYSSDTPSLVGRAAVLSLAAGALGLSRFGYGVLLPVMRSDLGWSYTQSGTMNTAHGLGYLAGALTAAAILAALGQRRSYLAAFVVVAATLLGSGLTASYTVLMSLRVLGGAAGAVLFISGATLAARLASASRTPGLVIGVYFAGVGPGILFSALLAPVVLAQPGGWRLGWLAMGAAAAVCVRPAAWAAPMRAAPAETAEKVDSASFPLRVRYGLGRLRWVLAAFVLFGLGYIPYMTFIIAAYRNAGASSAAIVLVWALLAVAATGSGWLWRPLLDRTSSGAPMALLLAVLAAATLLPVLSSAAPAVLVSAAVFGSTFLAVIAAVTQLVRRTLRPSQWTGGIAAATALFALGQAAGPALVGLFGDAAGGLTGGLGVAAVALVLAAAAALLHRAPDDCGECS